MPVPVTKTEVLRFGIFEVDLQSEELRKGGLRVKLPGQSFQILRLLLQRPGELVTRDELRQALWPGNTFVDFDHGLNAAVTRMRDALGDSADSPRFIETLPRRGYRFIGTLLPTNGNGAQAVAFPGNGNGSAAPVALPTDAEISRSRRAWVAVAGGMALLLLAGLLVLRHTGAPTSQNLTVTPFTSLPGREVNPAFSPDGTRIAFAWDGDPPEGRKGFDLYVKEIGSEHLLRLTHSADHWLMPTWSPDGRFIVFARTATGNSGVFMIPALGGEERVLRRNTGDFTSLSLSGDGRYLAYAQGLPNSMSRLALLEMQTFAPVEISAPSCLMASNPAFGPSGHQLAFSCTPSWGITDIYLMPEIGAQYRKLARVLGEPYGLAWTADERSLVLAVSRGRANLWRIDVSSGRAEAMLAGVSARSLAVSLRGNLLAFQQSSETSNIWRLDLQKKSASRLIASTQYEESAKYSPDGQFIVFESSRSGFTEIWMSRADGSDVLQLTHFGGPLTGSPSWAPDSRHIVFDSRDAGEANLYVMDINERVPHRLQINIDDDSVPSYSRDGQWIYFCSDAAGRGGIYKVPAVGGHATLVAAGEGYQSVESVDGRDLYYSVGHKRSVLHRRSLATGADVVLTALPSGGQLISWTPAPGGLYYVQELPTGEASVGFYDSTTDQVHKVADLPKDKQPTPMIGGLSLSPDGHSLIYAQIDQQESDIMLVENFR